MAFAPYKPRGGKPASGGPKVVSSKPQPTLIKKHRNPGISDGGSPGIGHPSPPKPGLAAKPPTKPPTTSWGGPAKPGLGDAPAPAAAAAPQGQHAAPDSTYNSTIDNINNHENTTLSQLNGAADKVKFDFGIGDPTNPFSRANGLKKAYLSMMKGRSAQLASQGQLYSGTHERAVERTRNQEAQAFSELHSAFDEAMGKIDQAKGGVTFQSEGDRIQAFQDWLSRAPEAEDAPVATDATSDAPASAEAPAAPQPNNAMFDARGKGDTASPPPAYKAATPPGALKPAPKGATRGLQAALGGKPKPTLAKGSMGQRFAAGQKAPVVKPKPKPVVKPKGKK